MNFFEEIKERKLRKYLAIYISACITIIGLVHLFSLRYNLPTIIFDALLVFVLFGLLSVSIIAWFHGKEGKQKIKKREYIYHSILLIAAFTLSFVLGSKGPIKILSLNSKTIAVLPFTNLSNAEEDEYFSDGITEDILTQLSKISDLKVISRTSVMKYKNTKLTIPEIGKELKAGSILEGSVRRFGNKFRITGQLINANSDEHIWAETFDRKVDDIFEVQSEIARYIAKELEASLAPKEEILLETKPTDNIEAYAFCLKGRSFASLYTDEDNEIAIEFYKKALQVDSKYALAYASLASAYDQKVRRYFYPEEWRDSAIEMSNKALSINPNLAEAHSSLAKSYEAKGQYDLAKFHYLKAIRLNPNYYAAIYNLGVVFYNEGSLDKAFKFIKESITLEPDNVFGYIVLGGIYQKFNCTESALSKYNQALELDPKNILTLLYIVEHHILQNDLQTADKYLMKLINISPFWPYGISLQAKLALQKKNYKSAINFLDQSIKLTGAEKEFNYGFALLKQNKVKEADKILKIELANYLDEIESNPNGSSIIENNISYIYAIMGNKKEALKWFEKSVNKGCLEYQQNLVSPYMDSLKTDKRFVQLVDVIKHKIDSMKTLASNYENIWVECN